LKGKSFTEDQVCHLIDTYYNVFNGPNINQINKCLEVPNIGILLGMYLKEDFQNFFQPQGEDDYEIKGLSNIRRVFNVLHDHAEHTKVDLFYCLDI
jgi:hypothetical protein